MARILIVDDEASVRDSLGRTVEREGHEVALAADLRTGRRLLAEGAFDLLLTDIRLGDGSGLDLVAAARQASPALRIVAMTAFGSVDLAVEAMRRGADDFIEKPFQPDVLRRRLERVLEPVRLAGQVARLERENQVLREEVEEEAQGDALVGVSPGMALVRDRIERVAPTAASVLIRGETGTGKELVARALHRRSARAGGPFVAFNGGAVAEGLAESELFGHEKGAFTGADRKRIGRFELADGGTLFLDEVGELAPALQVKLLRVLQERRFERVGGTATVEVDVRVVAATHRDLEQWSRDGRFREDLYYRLNVVTIEVPPLRDRPEDVPGLADLFLARYGTRPGAPRPHLAGDALAALQAQPWPGNVRELENTLHRACILARSEALGVEDLDLRDATAGGSADAPAGDLRATLARVERELIERAVREHAGNLSAAGRSLGVERNLLRYKLRKHGLRP
ncbi:MAG: sigma-54 dependent transcriptional regulator [Vicinamibacteria bacterium]